MKILSLIKQEKIFTIIFFFSLISSLRTLILPLQGDELTYAMISDNILTGKYYQVNYPSTVTPIIPFIMSFFKVNSFPHLGFILNKLFNIGLMFFGFRFAYLFFKEQKLNQRVILSILAITATNTIGIAFFPSLYPESILFFCFWGFMYYFNSELNTNTFLKTFIFFLLLSITRYLYLILGLLVVYKFYQHFKHRDRKSIYKLITYSTILALPLLFWFKYVYFIEMQNLSEISYFNRFKTDNQLLYNIKAGLGLIQHHEVSRINGIPAFVSLFIPITGFRNYIFSTLLIFAFIYGYLKKMKTEGLKILLTSIILLMTGLILAGTGFSRYWLILLPGFFLGYYLLATKFKVKDEWFIYASQFICFIYITNELRLDYLILTKIL
ncbi:hypothetical protein [Zunongwangia sp.]|uniref:hypothetical protein n=1 Tax=Zunongwangia sp. TaxID=1965325 RepID=UPI003AA97AA2